jgi:cobalamin biosynthesis protein CobT
MNERVHVMRQAIVKLTNLLAGKAIQVSQQGITAFVRADSTGRPVLVNLPYLPDNATDELIDAIQGFLDHEVAHILFTDFTLMGEAAKVGAANMLNLLEDTRIERCMAEKFSGSAYNLGKTGRFFLDKYTTPKIKEAIASGDQDMLIGVLTVPLIRAMAGQLVFKDFIKDHMATVDPLYEKIKDLEPQVQSLKSTQDALDLATEIVKRIRGEEEDSGGSGGGKGADKARVKVKAPGKGKGTGKGKGAAGKPEAGEDDEDKDDAAKGAAGAGEEEGDEEGEGAGAGTGEGEETPEIEALEESEDDDGDPGTASKSKGKKSDDPLELGRRDPLSWEAIDKETANDFDSTVSKAITDSAVACAADSDYVVYTTDKDVIEPLRVGSGYKDEMLKQLQDQTEHMVGPLQKDLERAIAARSLAQWNSGLRSGRLHAANLNRLAIPLPGGAVDDRVFRRKQETTSKDVAVELVVDCSGSMSGAKIHTATQAAYALASTLERIGIVSEVIAFTTGEAAAGSWEDVEEMQDKIGKRCSRAESLYMPVLKAFNERLSTEVKKRFGWLPNSSILASNVDGESVEIAAMRLLARREKGKVMIVLSDGHPAASGSAAELASHLKRTVERIAKRGVQVVGIGIQSDAVRKFYPKSIVLNNVSELPSVVMKELRGMIIH